MTIHEFQVGLIRPDVMSELVQKYPEVFFIRDIPKNEKIFEVCATTSIKLQYFDKILLFLIRQ